MDVNQENISEKIIALKKSLKEDGVDFKGAFERVDKIINKQVQEIKTEIATGKNPVPILGFQEINSGKVSKEEMDHIKKRGCLIIRNVFEKSRVTAWNEKLKQYIDKNQYLEKQKEKKGIDNYFSTLASSKPQIYGIYWSKPQMEARTSAELAKTRSWLNRMWKFDSENGTEFDPDQDCLYADRVRQREPGDDTLGLSPHIDGGSVERWLDENYRKVYRHILGGNPELYDPYDAAYRSTTREIPSPAVCSMFRTFQGWTALSKQGPGDGTLNLIPIANAMAWVYLRALQEDVPSDDLCGALPGKAMIINEKFHKNLMDVYTSIPTVEPGDSVWWHSDVIHGVEDKHTGKGYSNVIYIGSAPDCEKNRKYLPKQKTAFETGKSAPDFAAEDYETVFQGRFVPSDLSELGRLQMGYSA